MSTTHAALVLVPTPIGNLDDITLRAKRALEEADAIIAEDTRVTGRLLHHLGIGKPLISFHSNNEHRMVEQLVKRLARGERFALCSDAGTPAISDPGFLLVREAIRQGIAVECLPGATAFVPALVVSGLPCERFVFEGFLPQKKGRRTRIASLRDEERTLVFYESPHRVARMLAELAEAFGEERPASVSRELSKLHEETLRGTLGELAAHFAAHEPRGEFVVVVSGRQRAGRGSASNNDNNE
ncbi:MAG: 16S rRNA (cytidine(1402)-2'-O)-methyltransferase [Flavobacteriales bacterium]|nr:16S rRNA (cytidine(1402)-2'-O)-methyltransferase [Flavobacteriales bacterium]